MGVLVQCNYGARRELRIAGVPVGEEITDLLPCIASRTPRSAAERGRLPLAGCARSPSRCAATSWRRLDHHRGRDRRAAVAAPAQAHRHTRVARRRPHGRQGENGSGDIFIAFSTANARAAALTGATRVADAAERAHQPLFYATVQATEEAIVNAMLAAETMTGANDLRVYALPHDRLMAAMRKYGRLR